MKILKILIIIGIIISIGLNIYWLGYQGINKLKRDSYNQGFQQAVNQIYQLGKQTGEVKINDLILKVAEPINE